MSRCLKEVAWGEEVQRNKLLSFSEIKTELEVLYFNAFGFEDVLQLLRIIM